MMLHSSLTQPRAQVNFCRDAQSEIRSKARTKTHFKPLGDLGLRNVDFVTSGGKLSRFGALHRTFEDSERSNQDD